MSQTELGKLTGKGGPAGGDEAGHLYEQTG